MSSAITPGERPAPDSPWSDVITTRSTPNASCRGLRVIASPVVVQFGTGVTKPFQPRFRRWTAISASWSMLTPGMKIGTSGSSRKAEAVETTRGGLGVARLKVPRRVGLHGREDEIHRCRVQAGRVLHGERGEGGMQRLRAVPAEGAGGIGDRLAVRLARGPLGRRERGDLEVGMAGERGQELLAGHAGSADDGDPHLLHGSVLPGYLIQPTRKKTDTRG